MRSDLHKKFNKIEDIRHRINFHLASWDDVRLNLKPAEGKWSVGQVLYHLIQSEELSVKYVNKKISYPDSLKSSGLGSSFRSFLLNFFLNLKVKYKAPAPIANIPDNLSKDDLLLHWEKVRKEMASLLDTVPEEFLDKNIFKHLVVGRMTLSQMMDFIYHHIKHHLPQIFQNQKTSS